MFSKRDFYMVELLRGYLFPGNHLDSKALEFILLICTII